MTIQQRVAELRVRDPKLSLFGASGHRYELFPRLAEKRVAAFERKWHVSLPADYRRFLVEIGNGGAGPAYGLFKLGEEGDSARDGKPFRRNAFVGDPSKPFAHDKAWNLPRAAWKQKPDTRKMTPAEDDRAWTAWEALRAKDYWHGSIMNGALPICHLGCAYRQWLVVSGPRSGEVWNDERVDERGIAPLTNGKRRVHFTEWYESWLAASLRKARRLER